MEVIDAVLAATALENDFTLVTRNRKHFTKIQDLKILTQIIKTKKELDNIPILANADFGHTAPMITFPIGGEAELEVSQSAPKLTITKH